jgi:hypothetical protein
MHINLKLNWVSLYLTLNHIPQYTFHSLLLAQVHLRRQKVKVGHCLLQYDYAVENVTLYSLSRQ